MTEREDRICELLCEVARPLILKEFRVNSCVASSRVGKRVLDHYEIPSKPIAVKIDVFNSQYCSLLQERGDFPSTEEGWIEWRDLGAWNVGIDNEDLGHIVLIVRGNTLLDLSMDQMSRPDKKIILNPSGFSIPDDFVSNPQWAVFQDVYGCVARYMAQPENKAFSTSRDWTTKSRTTKIVQNVINLIDRELINANE